MIDLKKNKSFCILPFIHMSLVDGRIKPCCRFSPDEEIVEATSDQFKKGDNLKKIFNGFEYRNLREKMLSGKMIKGCYKCYLEENSGGVSIRQGAYNDFKHLLNSDFEPILKFLEIGFSNICNLKCRTCSSTLSTSWSKDEILAKTLFNEIKIKKQKNKSNKFFFQDEDLQNLKHVKFVGGEPMLNPEFLPFLEKLVELKVNKNCILELFTNSSYFPDNRVVNNLVLFEGARIHLSVDGYGEKNDYIRHFSKWNKVDDVIGKWLDVRANNKNISIQLEVAVSIYNIIYFEDLLDWWIEKNNKIKNGECRIHMIFVFSPEYLSARNIPEDLKMKIKDIIKRLISKYKNYEHIIFWLKNIELTMLGKGENKINEFLRYTKALDKIREENFSKTFPELNNIIKKYL
jgi:MoaA/NifB/PqqE/SkfB family radical SAM enzyme